jgi:plastocyanin
MIWRLPTFGRRLLLIALAAVPAVAATVSGSVRLTGSRAAQVRRGNDFSGVAVWLAPADGRAIAVQPARVTMLQKKKTFIPHVLAIPAGTTVDFPNGDPIFHNAFSNFSGQIFDIGLYPPGTSQRVVFKREGIVRIFCNIHPTTSAVIIVVKTPYVTVTDKSGAFSFDGVPPGEYRLHLFHERASEATLQELERTVVVQSAPVRLAALTISESGYLQVPHKNKHGKEYPPVIEDTPVYSGRQQ